MILTPRSINANTLTRGLLAACVMMLGAAPVLAEPLDGELRLLLDSHPKIQEAYNTLESKRAGVDGARSLYYPRVSVTGDIGPEIVDSPAERANDPQGNSWHRTRQTISTQVVQNVFDGFRTRSQVRNAEMIQDNAAVTLETARQSILFEGIKAYIDVLRQRRLMELAEESERTIQRQLNLEDERVRRGSGVTVDVLQAKSRLQISKERRVGYQGALINAISHYDQVFTHPPRLSTMADPAPPAEIVPSTLERAIEIALDENPALSSGAITVEAARERRRLGAADYYPSIDVVGRAGLEKHRNTVTGVRREYSVVLQANWDIFTGFSTPATVEQANFDYHASIENYDFTATKVIEQTRLAWQSLLTARERKQLLGNAVNIAYEVFQSRLMLRDAGKETVLNVLDAENEVNNAQINYIRATYDERTAIYQLLLAMGRLNPDYLVTIR